MTPGARIAAAIEILDDVIAGAPAERALTGWARNSRFAGSKDRAAIRDHVFDALRGRRSLSAWAEGESGRALMIGLAHRRGDILDQLFNGAGHAPSALPEQELATLATPPTMTDAQRCDVPEWLWPDWLGSLGDQAASAAMAQQQRAAVFLRVNTRRVTVADAVAQLAEDGVRAEPHPWVNTCLQIAENERRIKNSAAYLDGFVELQDAASQQAVAMVPVRPNATVLDYCAGGGGKALALADMHDARVFAHDIAPERTKDLPARATRAGVDIKVLKTAELAAAAPFDVVFCDAPCSGSGTWRRSPDAKWRLTSEQLKDYGTIQRKVIASAAALAAPDGVVVYATCSVLKSENDEVVEAFCAANPTWSVTDTLRLYPRAENDGFFASILRRTQATDD